MVGASAAERESVLESLGADAGGRGRILLVERHSLEGRDAERLPVGADEDRGGAALLRVLSLGPGGDELVTLPGDAHRLERPDARIGVVEARSQHSLRLGPSLLGVAVVSTCGDKGEPEGDDHRDDDHRDDETSTPASLAGRLGRLGHLRLGRRAGGVDGAGQNDHLTFHDRVLLNTSIIC